MPEEPVVSRRLCGLGIRDADAVAKVAGALLHVPCAEAAHSDRSDWAHTEIGTLNQLAQATINGGVAL